MIKAEIKKIKKFICPHGSRQPDKWAKGERERERNLGKYFFLKIFFWKFLLLIHFSYGLVPYLITTQQVQVLNVRK